MSMWGNHVTLCIQDIGEETGSSAVMGPAGETQEAGQVAFPLWCPSPTLRPQLPLPDPHPS